MIPVIDSIPGILRLPTEPRAVVLAELQWSDYLCNKILILVAIVWLILVLSEMVKIVPQILFSISRARGSGSLEYNLSLARMRNGIAISSVVPFCLLVSRFKLYCATFWLESSAEWNTLMLFTLVYAYVLLRVVMYSVIRLKRLSHSYKAAMLRGSYGFFILLVAMMLIAAGLLFVLRIDDSTIALVLYALIGLAFLLSSLRCLQILKLSYRSLASFLYLCALELAPAVVVVASAIYL